MFRKFIGFALICAILIAAFLMLERCNTVGGGKSPLAVVTFNLSLS
ncbi:MAG: hypothetical protein ACRBBP_05280 [Bdellovibrionales bacterium]